MLHEMSKHIEWDVHEFEHREKKTDWFWAVALISVGGAIIAIFANNIIFAILLVLAGGLMIFFGAKKPEMIHVEISEQGIKINSDLYPYDNLDSFWLIEKEEHGTRHILLHTTSIMSPFLNIPLEDDIDIETLREVLLAYLPESKKTEPLSHRISDKIGF